MAIHRTPKQECIHDAIQAADDAVDGLNGIESDLRAYVLVYGGDGSRAEYIQAVKALKEARANIAVMREQVCTLARRERRGAGKADKEDRGHGNRDSHKQQERRQDREDNPVD